VKLSIPFAYKAHRDNRRSFKECFFKAAVAVEPAAHCAAEAPVAFRMPCFGGGRKPEAAPPGDVRRIGAAFYEPLLTYDYDADRGAWFAVPVAAASDKPPSDASVSAALYDVAPVKLGASHNLTFISEKSKGAYSHYEKDRVWEAMRRLAATLVAVDGVVHRRIAEPVLTLDLEGKVALNQYAGYSHPGERLFRLDETDVLVETASAIDPIMGAANVRTALAGFELVDPSLLMADFAEECLGAAAHRLKSAVAKDAHLHPIELLLAYDDLRLALGAGRDRSRPDSVAAPLETAAAMLAAAAQAERSPSMKDGLALASLARRDVAIYEGRAGSLAPEDATTLTF
jgi:hypothetical protein